MSAATMPCRISDIGPSLYRCVAAADRFVALVAAGCPLVRRNQKSSAITGFAREFDPDIAENGRILQLPPVILRPGRMNSTNPAAELR